MKIEQGAWDFHALLWKFHELKRFLVKEWEKIPYHKWPELRQLQSLLNAITDGHYSVETIVGREDIKEAFFYGFDMQHVLYTEKQVMQIKELMQHAEIESLIAKLGKLNTPYLVNFYNELFIAHEAGYKYITAFDKLPMEVKMSAPFNTINEFKIRELDPYIYRQNSIIEEAMMLLLGDKFRRGFNSENLASFSVSQYTSSIHEKLYSKMNS